MVLPENRLIYYLQEEQRASFLGHPIDFKQYVQKAFIVSGIISNHLEL